MKPFSKIYAITVLFTFAAFAPHSGTAQESATIVELLELAEGEYFADRDSAYLDPYYGIKKLIYGNRRFADNKSIRPRQTNADLKNTELGQQPFATIIGCSDSGGD